MELKDRELQTLIDAPGFHPKQLDVSIWYEVYLQQQQQLEQQQQQLEQMQAEVEALKEKLRKFTQRTSENSSQPPSQDGYKKKNKSKEQTSKPPKKRGPKYGHPGKTRNGFEQVDERIEVGLEQCPSCGGALERVCEAPVRRHQVAELVAQPVVVREYERPKYQCTSCGWSGYGEMPLGSREDFSYGALLSSLVGWLGYGGNLSWGKQRYLVETILGIPLSQGSLAKMHQWFCESLYPSYEQWWRQIQQPGVRCVDETSYRLNGVNYWLWVATSKEVCVLFLAPTRGSREVKALLGEDFSGILSSDCWAGYSPQAARAKQKCLAHVGRELKAMEKSRFESNREFAAKVLQVLKDARQIKRDNQAEELSLEEMQQQRPIVETKLAKILDNPPKEGWASDAQKLSNRFRRHWEEWFTFLSEPEVKADNNDAERALRPVVVHRKVSGGARSHWGGQLVAMMYSFLETMRLQGKNAVEELCKVLAEPGRSPPMSEKSALT